MHPVLQKLRTENLKKPFVYTRIIDNRMSIVGHKLFKSDRVLHLAFIVHRLHRDFGFTWYEVANFTGIPVKDIKNIHFRLKPILDSKILETLKRLDYNQALHEWRELPDGHGTKPQGYFILRDRPAWYNDKRWTIEPYFKFGSESEKDYLEKLNE